MTIWSPASSAAASSRRSIRFARSSRFTERTKSPYPSQWNSSACGGWGRHFGPEPCGATRAVRRRCVRSRRAEWPRRGQPDRAPALSVGSRGPRASRRTAPSSVPIEVVRLAELVNEPHALVGVANEVGRKLRSDDDVDPLAVRLVEIEHPPQKRLREHARPRVPLEGNADEIRVVASCAQLVDESVGEDLGPTSGERHLGPQDGDVHGSLGAKRLDLGLEAIDLLLKIVDQAQRRGVEGALVVRERLHVPAHELSENSLDRSPEPAAHARSQAQRAVGGNRPEPLGLCARGTALLVAPRSGAGICPGPPHLLPKLLGRALLRRPKPLQIRHFRLYQRASRHSSRAVGPAQ